MRRNLFLLILICLTIFVMKTCCFAQTPDRFKIVKGSKQYLLKFTGRDQVKVKNLQTVFNFNVQPGRGTSSIKVNGMEYTGGLISQAGEFYVPLKQFLDFFLVESVKSGTHTWTIKDEGILNVDLIQEEQAAVTPAGGKAVTMSVLDINGSRFIDLDKFALETGKKSTVNPVLGTARFNNKPIYRWLKFKDKKYAFIDDLASAFGGKIALGDAGMLEDEAKTRQDIKNNVTASYDGQKQYKKENTDMPRGYTILVKVSNDYYTPLPISYDTMALIGKDGKEYLGTIIVYGGTRPSSEFLDNKNRGKVTDASNTIKPRSEGYVVCDFVPPKDMEPDYVLFRYKGVILMKQDISRDPMPEGF